MSKRTDMIDGLADEIYNRVSDDRCAFPLKDKTILKNTIQQVLHHLAEKWVEEIKENPDQTDPESSFVKGAHRVFHLIHTSTDYHISENRLDYVGVKYKRKKVA